MDQEVVILHGSEWKLSDIADDIEYCRKLNWVLKKWAASAALAEKNDGTGLLHDHCQICWWTLSDSQRVEENTGYSDGKSSWLCLECWEKFIHLKKQKGA